MNKKMPTIIALIIAMMTVFALFAETNDASNLMKYKALSFSKEESLSKLTTSNEINHDLISYASPTKVETTSIRDDEVAYAPLRVRAEIQDNNAVITWEIPVAGGEATSESFESSFPPTDWEVIHTNLEETWEQYGTLTMVTGNIEPTDGNYMAGVMWNFNHQDEWLITEEMHCPTGNLTFDYFGREGSDHGDNYFVKISTDNGTTWTPIWNASDLPAADNGFARPIVVDLNDYAGEYVKIAWNWVDGDGGGLWYASYIDNIRFGETRIDTADLFAFSRASSSGSPANLSKRNENRALLGYQVWRLFTFDQTNEGFWTPLTDNTLDALTYTDTSWDTLPSGSYKYAVKAIYTDNNISPAAFSNVLLKDMNGVVEGMVTDASNAPVVGAVVLLDGSTLTTDDTGFYIFTDILAGEYDITASATGFVPSTQRITVNPNQVTTANFTLIESELIMNDGFETYPDFSLEADPWVFHDIDGNITYGITAVSFPHTTQPMAYIIFNPSTTTPPLNENYAAYAGSKYAACFDAELSINDDWMITPAFEISQVGTFSFMAKSITASFGLERFNVLVSTGSTDPADFVSISGSTYVQAPASWTHYSYDLSAYANQTIRVAIQCVSANSHIFMVDNVEIDAPTSTNNENNEVVAISSLEGNYPNPFNPETTIAFSTKENGNISLDIYNIRGQKVRTLLNETKQAGKHTVVWNGKDDNGKNVASGVFFYRMKSGKFSSTKKMILMK